MILNVRKIMQWFIIITAAVFIVVSCNNPFSTRKAQDPGDVTGAPIKPATSPENVLYNLKASFESMSIQDYLDIFSEDFVFNPDREDSVMYLEDFRDGWGFEKERTYAENFLQINVTSYLEFFTDLYEYKAGEGMFDYIYSIMVFPATDSTKVDETINNKYMVKGHAWLYLRENDDGQWKIYKWTEITSMIDDAFITWGVLRVRNAGY